MDNAAQIDLHTAIVVLKKQDRHRELPKNKRRSCADARIVPSDRGRLYWGRLY